MPLAVTKRLPFTLDSANAVTTGPAVPFVSPELARTCGRAYTVHFSAGIEPASLRISPRQASGN